MFLMMFESVYIYVDRPMVHLFGHTRQSAVYIYVDRLMVHLFGHTRQSAVYIYVDRPMVHLFGHTRQSAELLSKHGVLFSNGSQFASSDVTWPNVIDIYIRPELPSKTKIYKLPTWKEAEVNANSTSTDAEQQTTTSSKPSCCVQ